MISEFTMSAGALGRPEFPNMLWRQISSANVAKNEVLNSVTIDRLNQIGEVELISSLQNELQTIAQAKIDNRSELVGQAVRDGVFTGVLVSQNILLANLPISTQDKLVAGTASILSGVQFFISAIGAQTVYPIAKKIGGEIERISAKKSLNRDVQDFLKSDCHIDSR